MAASVRSIARIVLSDSRRKALVMSSGPGINLTCRVELGGSRFYNEDHAGRTTSFGFETVSEEEKGERVYKVFESVAPKYDVMNDAMSLGVHRLWKDTLLRVMNPLPGARLLDSAGGTGDIAFRFLNYTRSRHALQQRAALRSQQTPSWQDISRDYASGERAVKAESRVVVCDINKEMLTVGKEKAERLGFGAGVSWVVGDAEELPFDDDQFDVYTVAFGIRNVTHIEQALQEALRVLKPGGRFLCLEFSKVSNPLLSSIYDAYSFQVIPVLGEVIAGDWKSYQYLVESIRRFPDQETFKAMIEDAGFFRVQYFNLTGGVVAIHSGFKL
ncbi:2-methoxy-6-polyprenyl-1,4-benzoquinol methylase, mitochondrial-like [Denticeps clupeoides]|uniref:2-methoxy-6-polyprenyl-1,4-benzoquinol methylase, mitochondrial-like n=1 Tax=Denticeps clupeoides TaxID=299321 RepID=UPI0010A36769|nr:2-methoxy-6-polyprenyl-1,4-benzoquinol methylase, mitochondrial-like [Denticeps clupeoides]XP_028852378.1 2-methoxy-6-polyprenyl-1,4-benzoquinol methylase, mitochondrial-like [Denticeps clupeoides]